MIFQLRKMMIYSINIMAIFVYLEKKAKVAPFPVPVFEKLPDQGLKSEKF